MSPKIEKKYRQKQTSLGIKGNKMRGEEGEKGRRVWGGGAKKEEGNNQSKFKTVQVRKPSQA